MKTKSIIIAAIICSAFALASCSDNKTTDNGASAIENIMTRTSVRSYTDQEVDDAQIETILRAAMAAPTARNVQPWEFVVIKDKESMKALAEKLPYSKMLADAPLAIAVCGNMQRAIEGEGRGYWIQDCSAATENLLLAAHALGLGAVWTGVYPVQERVGLVSEALNLPSYIIPLGVMVIGYPDGQNQPKDKWDPEKIHYNKW